MQNRFTTKTLPKTKKFSWRKIWQLRYRAYAIIIIFILLPVLFANDINLPDQITVNSYDFEVIEENDNVFAQNIRRIPKETNPDVAAGGSENGDTVIGEVRYDGDQIQYYDIYGKLLTEKILRELGINAGFISSQPFVDLGDGLNLSDEELEDLKNKVEQGVVENNQPKRLNDLVPAPPTATFRNLLVYEKYKIRAPIQYTGFEDLFAKDGAGNIDFTRPLDTSSVNSPVQKKLEQGIVHMAYTPRAGEIGNSYIVGHSSNFSYIKSAYNTVFKPIQEKSQVGEVFTIYDEQGRQLNFRVFEAIKIADNDVTQAYKNYPDQRVVTLQTSILGLRNGKWEATHRWLTRGELIQ